MLKLTTIKASIVSPLATACCTTSFLYVQCTCIQLPLRQKKPAPGLKAGNFNQKQVSDISLEMRHEPRHPGIIPMHALPTYSTIPPFLKVDFIDMSPESGMLGGGRELGRNVGCIQGKLMCRGRADQVHVMCTRFLQECAFVFCFFFQKG